MNQFFIRSIICLLVFYFIDVHSESTTNLNAVANVEKKISDYILKILEHFKQKDPVGLPGAPIADPMDIPPMSRSVPLGNLKMFSIKLQGQKQFHIDNMLIDLAGMKVDIALTIKKLHVNGNYTVSSFFVDATGLFTVNLTDVSLKGTASLAVAKEGKLEAQDINMDVHFHDMSLNFENLGAIASMFQDMMNSGGGSFIFDSIKPFVLSEVNRNTRNDINQQIQKMPQTFPNSVSPLDQLIAEARRKVRNMGYDPFKLENKNQTLGLSTIYMTHTWIHGLSSFHRVGNMTVELKNKTVLIQMEIGTQRLEGTSHWEVSFIGLMSKTGTVKFTVEYLIVLIKIQQNIDVRHHPILDDIQIELGNIQIRFDGAGTLDYIIELGINVLPNLIRYQIMDALEAPIKSRIQENLDRINLEEKIHDYLPTLDEQQAQGFTGLL